MKLMRGDMGTDNEFLIILLVINPLLLSLGGAATVVASTLAIAQLKIPWAQYIFLGYNQHIDLFAAVLISWLSPLFARTCLDLVLRSLEICMCFQNHPTPLRFTMLTCVIWQHLCHERKVSWSWQHRCWGTIDSFRYVVGMAKYDGYFTSYFFYFRCIILYVYGVQAPHTYRSRNPYWVRFRFFEFIMTLILNL